MNKRCNVWMKVSGHAGVVSAAPASGAVLQHDEKGREMGDRMHMRGLFRFVVATLLVVGASLSLTVADAQALQVKKGTFQTGTAAGNVAVTGVGFTPKAVIFYYTWQNALDTNTALMSVGYGFAAGSPIVNRGTAAAGTDNQTTSITGYRRSETYSLVMLSNGTPTLSGQGSVTAFNADGFTVNWNTAPGTSAYVHYVALGGTDLNAAAGTLALSNVTGNQSVTGLSFQPNFVNFVSSWTGAVDANNAHGLLNIGFSDGTSQGTTSISFRDADTATTNPVSYQITTAALAGLNTADPPVVDFVATLASMNADGFTVNKSNAPAAAIGVFYLALRGPGFKVGAFNRNTAAGNQNITGVGFQPALVYLQSFNRAAGTGVAANAEISMGAGDGTNQGSAWGEYRDPGTDDANIWTTTGNVIVNRSATTTIDAAATLSSFGADGFTLNWTPVNTATAFEHLYWAANPCTFNAPTVTLTPATSVIPTAAGNTAYTVSVTNNDTGVCADVSYTLTANNAGGTNPGGFSTAVTGSPLVVAQGATGTATLTVTQTSATSGQTIINTATAAATSHTNGVSGTVTTTYTTNPYTRVDNGTPNAGNVTLDPGAGPVNLDAFGLTVGNGAGTDDDVITALTVTLSANSDKVSRLELWDNPPTAKFADLAFVSGQDWAVSGLTLAASDTAINQYMVRVVAAAVVPAGSYPLTGRVSAITSQRGFLVVNGDAAEAVVTIQSGTNSTTAGVMSFSNVTSDTITVAVAYSGDNNRNNVCVLAWGTDGSTYPNTLTSSNDRDANSCSATASGLAMGTLYYFRATLTDAETAVGSPVVGSQRTSLLQMLHSSAVLGNKYPTWGANYTCATCHDKNTAPNVKRIRATVGGVGLTNAAGTVVTGNALSATTVTGATTNLADNAATNKVCDACHGSTLIYKRGLANATSGTPAMITGASPPHPADPDCVKCHEHRKGFKVNAGCVSCHAANALVGVYQAATGAPSIVDTTGAALRTEAYGGHLRLTAGENITTITDWDKRCLACHDGHDNLDGVTIPENVTVGIDYISNSITLGGTATSGSTEAEICWNCHDQNGDGDLNDAGDISEWGTNTDANTNNSPYNYGQLSTKNWTTATWSSSRTQYAYKTGAIQSTHTGNPAVTDAALTGTAYGYTETKNAVADIRCSYCHDVHNTANLKGTVTGDVNGKPYLRGSWRGNPYEEDGAPRRSYASTTYFENINPGLSNPIGPDPTAGWGQVPRGSVNQAMLGGYWIDQNNVTPMSATTTAASGTAAKNPTTGWTTAQFAGLCALCHGGADKVFDVTASATNEIDTLDKKTGEALWMGTNGHANSVIGGRGNAGANETNVYDARGGVAGTTLDPFAAYQGYTVYPADDSTVANDGFRSANTSALMYSPPLAASNTRPFMAGINEWAVDRIGTATAENKYHNFSCSKCHNPHASRLPKLMITNCLDTKHNTWDNQFQLSAVGANNTNMEVGNWTSAQNCHRYAANNPNAGNTQENDNTTTATVPVSGVGAGWNKVTPWTSTTNTE